MWLKSAPTSFVHVNPEPTTPTISVHGKTHHHELSIGRYSFGNHLALGTMHHLGLITDLSKSPGHGEIRTIAIFRK